MQQLLRSSMSLGVAAGCAAAVALPGAAPATAAPNAAPIAAAAAAPGPAAADTAALRALGPAALPPLLARWDRLPPGPERDALARQIDAVAAQRYATASRLYWYTDLDAALGAARAQGRPVLALRMLGRLDEDLSCANSRFFRATLYANTAVSRYLRDHFVLYWSSERPVPRVTIDFGDGRRLERTTTGNSAHYVLGADGAVLDVLPGLYAPAVFQAELGKSEALARRVAALPAAARAHAVAQHHRGELEAGARRFAAAAGTAFLRGAHRLLAPDELGDAAVARAQRAAMAKARIETIELARIGIDAGSIPDGDVAAWAVVGQKLWGVMPATAPAAPAAPAAPGRRAPAPLLLDAPSRALVAQLHDAGPVRSTEAERAAVIARLEQSILADTAMNELRLRPQIRALLAYEPGATAPRGLDALNARVYATVFHTPRSDAWLGLLPRTDFTGLPGDGVVMP